MQLQSRNLEPGHQGNDVRLLQYELQILNYSIEESELQASFFGDSTKTAVAEFQGERNLEETGIVDQTTATLINQDVDESGNVVWRVEGRVREESGAFRQDLNVQVVDSNRGQEEQMGEAVTDSEGFYQVDTPSQVINRPDGQHPNIIVRVVDSSGRLLAESDERPNANPLEIVDLTVPVEDSSEVERLLASAILALPDVDLAGILDQEIPPLAETMNEPVVLVRALVAAARLSNTSGLRLYSLYAFTRPDTVHNLEDFLRLEEGPMEQAIRTAAGNNWIPALEVNLVDPFRDEVRQFKAGRVSVQYTFEGRLISETDNSPLANYRVEALADGAMLAATGTSADGLFTIWRVQTISRGASVDLPPRIELVLQIDNPAGHRIARQEVTALQEGASLQDIAVNPDIPPTSSSELVEIFSSDLNDAQKGTLVEAMTAAGINSIEDIRTVAGFRLRNEMDMTNLDEAVYGASIDNLDGAARLHTIVADHDTKRALVDGGYTDFQTIAQTSPGVFAEAVGPAVGEGRALQVHGQAAAVDQHLGNVSTATRAEIANGARVVGPVAEQLGPDCTCEDCKSAVSPAAYLTELLRYAQQKVRHGNQSAYERDPDYFTNTFFQPFKALPVQCSAVEDQERQVRLATEVLLKYLFANQPQDTDAQQEYQQNIQAAFEAYLQSSYQLLLNKIGSSYAEIRLIRRSEVEERTALSNRLGISQRHLDQLFISLSDLTEQNLAALFGLKAFRQANGQPDPSLAPVRDFTFRQWRLEYLRYLWYLQDFPRNPFSDSYIFQTDTGALGALDNQTVSDALRATFAAEGYPLSNAPVVRVLTQGGRWFISDSGGRFLLRLIDDRLKVFEEREYPIIDPDLIGPDDLRRPEAGQAVFDLWVRRRNWVDTRLEAVSGLTKRGEIFPLLQNGVDYQGIPVAAWSANVSLADLKDWSRKLARGEDVESIEDQIATELNLETRGFNRLMELLQIIEENDPGEDPDLDLEPEERQALNYLLTSVWKTAIRETWIVEERSNDLLLGLQDFWISQTEPLVGDWIPEGAARPYIDPERINLTDLADSVAGRPAIELWDQRTEWLQNERDRLRDVFEQNQAFQELLDDVFPADLQTRAFDDLLGVLNRGLPDDNTDLQNARDRITNDLQLPIADFRLIMEVKAKVDDLGVFVSESEWNSLLVVLSRLKWRYLPADDPGNWARQEANLPYWQIFKQTLPKWLAGAGLRRLWQQALEQQSRLPNIEPDLLSDTEDFKTPRSDNPAFLAYEAREDWINAQLITTIPPANQNAWFNDRLLEKIGITASELMELEAQRLQGRRISPRLQQLNLSFAMLGVLVRLKKLLDDAPNEVLEEEWTEVFFIFLQVEKVRQYAAWREEERLREWVIGPDLFALPEPNFQLTLTPTSPLPQWRATLRNRRNWQDTLEARIEQEKELGDGLRRLVSEVEEITIPALRDRLIDISNAEGVTTSERADWLGDHLLIDFQMDGCLLTTRISLAIEVFQTLLWSLRTGILKDTYPNLQLHRTTLRSFDEDWPWLGSYAGWRAATFVFMYPQNVLHPALRKFQSWQFAKTVEYINDRSGITPKEAGELADTFEQYYLDITQLEVEVSCQMGNRTYWYARSREGRCYWSFFELEEGPDKNPDFGQSPWVPITVINEDEEVKIERFVGSIPFGNGNKTPESILLLGISRNSEKASYSLVGIKHTYPEGENGFVKFGDDLAFPMTVDGIENLIFIAGQYRKPTKLIEVDFYYKNKYYRNKINERFEWKYDWIQSGASEGHSNIFNHLVNAQAVLAANVKGKSRSLYFFHHAPAIGNNEFNTRNQHYLFIGGRTGSTPIEREGQALQGYWLGAFLWPATGGDKFMGIAKTNTGSVAVSIDTDNSYTIIERFRFQYLQNISIDSGTPARENQYLIIAERRLRQVYMPEYVLPTEDRPDNPEYFRKETHAWTASMYKVNTTDIGNPWDLSFQYNRMPWQIMPSAFIESSDKSFLLNNPLPPKPDLAADDYALRRAHTRGVYAEHQYVGGAYDFNRSNVFGSFNKLPLSTLAYIEEYYYLFPLLIALELRRRGYYTEALDWFRLVYDYTQPDPAERKIWFGLELEERPPENAPMPTGGVLQLEREIDWLRDPLNPHGIAAVRPNTYTRYTLQALVGSLLDYADSEFTKDTAETLPRARELYELALYFLDRDVLDQKTGQCERIIAELVIEIGEATDEVIGEGRREDLEELTTNIQDMGRLEAVAVAIAEGMEAIIEEIGRNPDWSRQERWTYMVDTLAIAEEVQAEPATTGEVMVATTTQTAEVYDTLLSGDAMFQSAQAIAVVEGNIGFGQIGSLPGGPPAAAARTRAMAMAAPDQLANDGSSYFRTRRNPAPAIGFCIPPNPILFYLRLQAEVNLFKIRNCLNIAGMRRELDPYAAATDTVTGIPYIGSGGQLVLPGVNAIQPTLYRFPFLLERARRLVEMAAQVESAMLNAIEKKESEELRKLEQKQRIKLAREDVKLQNLRVREAQENFDLSELKRERVEISQAYYRALIEEGLLSSEEFALALSIAAGVQQAIAGSIYLGESGTLTAEERLRVAQSAGYFASATQTSASILLNLATYERRAQQWQYELNLANQDFTIAEQEIVIAKASLQVVGQESRISELKAEQAEEIGDFLNEKFTNVQLYSWMSNILEGVYRYFLHQATATARLATNQLAFERQEVPPVVIQDNYWDVPSLFSLGIGDNDGPDRRGLTGSARLLKDLTRLDQYAFESEKRKLQLSRTISLSRLDPFAFAQLRQTGKMTFRTNMELFDRDFPGHYLRLIKRVRVSVIALVPPEEGIRASLTNTGLSRVVIGGNIFQTILLRRAPELVALTAAQNALGLFEFELQRQTELLYPFEGSGVDSLWEFDMPKASNFFDFSTIADLLFTVEYTALNSYLYRKQIIQELGDSIENSRVYSFRYQFADAWYDLHHPDLTNTPMRVTFQTLKADFPANIDDLTIRGISLFIVRARDEANAKERPPALTLELGFIPTSDISFISEGELTLLEASSNNGIYTTSQGNSASWLTLLNRAPDGKWILQLPNTEDVRDLFDKKKIEDIIFSIDYRGRTAVWDA